MSQYKVRNWSQYNESLQKRASLSVWISEDALKKWKSAKNPYFIGAPQQYSNDAILCMMTLKVIYHLPYRQLVGFLISLFMLMGVNLKIPHFTTIAARAKSLGVMFKKLSKKNPTDLVFDSTGFKVYGEGEWTVRQHGKQKRRRWKKFHIGVCPRSQEIIMAEVTELEKTDGEIGAGMLKKAPRSVEQAIGDGAYDIWKCYRVACEKGIKFLTPPRQGAVLHEGNELWIKQRNDAISTIIGLGNNKEAVRLWKKLTGYHERSLVETAFSRFKGIFGEKLFSKSIKGQEVELLAKTHVMNKMTGLGMPKGVMI